MTRQETAFSVLGAVAGIALVEVATIQLSPLRLDFGWYGTTGLPLLGLLAAVLGYFAPRQAWRWGLIPTAAALIWILIRSRDVGNLWPIFVVVFMATSIVPIVGAYIGVLLRRWCASRSQP